ncbi:MAG: haloalkane dehalogenase [Armatimonadota bacterium]|nr:MAG: haloalkane dehalogenase [Armatimonadota bacterium]
MTDEAISPDFPYESHYADVLGSRMHYVEQGAGDPILFVHGTPTWSYLWRNVIPHLSSAARCVALDLIGMGRSDKPDIEYRFLDHARYFEGFIEKLGLQNITLVIHDWGSALGFHYAMRHEHNVKGLAFMEAILAPVRSWDVFPPDLREMYQTFRTPNVGWEMIVNRNAFVENVLPSAVLRKLTDEEMDYYREPFKEPASRRPLWRWPNEVPVAGEPADVAEAVETYSRRLRESDLPKLLLYATPGAILRAPLVDWCRRTLKNLATVDIGPGLHFVQEDRPHRIGAELAAWYGAVD